MGPGREALVERTRDEPDEATPAASEARAPRWSRLTARLPRTRRFWFPAGAVLIVVVVLVAWLALRDTPEPITRAEIAAGIQQGIEKAQQDQANAPPTATAVYQKILPSLVTVTTKDGALGTGVIIKADGTVLTALHVVEDGSDVRLEFTDGTDAAAEVIGRQPANDTAVLLPSTLPQVVVPAVIGGGAQIGNDVYSAGNPLGLRDSLTAGVVSGLNRSTNAGGKRILRGLIQFDAAVNPGNSGGPLLDRHGQVIGIVTGLANPSRQPYFVGIGFAVPIETAGGGAGAPRK